jgi:hypothetical protein
MTNVDLTQVAVKATAVATSMAEAVFFFLVVATEVVVEHPATKSRI